MPSAVVLPPGEGGHVIAEGAVRVDAEGRVEIEEISPVEM